MKREKKEQLYCGEPDKQNIISNQMMTVKIT